MYGECFGSEFLQKHEVCFGAPYVIFERGEFVCGGLTDTVYVNASELENIWDVHLNFKTRYAEYVVYYQ